MTMAPGPRNMDDLEEEGRNKALSERSAIEGTTPRTDAAVLARWDKRSAVVYATFARQLERELVAALDLANRMVNSAARSSVITPSEITDLKTANGVIDYLRGYVKELQTKLSMRPTTAASATVTCENCAFRYGAEHVKEGSTPEAECPVCGEQKLLAARSTATRALPEQGDAGLHPIEQPDDLIRTAYEVWAGGKNLNINRKDGGYAEPYTEWCWHAFYAATRLQEHSMAATAARSDDELVRTLRNMAASSWAERYEHAGTLTMAAELLAKQQNRIAQLEASRNALSTVAPLTIKQEFVSPPQSFLPTTPYLNGMTFETDVIVNGHLVKAGTEIKFAVPDNPSAKRTITACESPQEPWPFPVDATDRRNAGSER